jgi:hypothetical protein
MATRKPMRVQAQQLYKYGVPNSEYVYTTDVSLANGYPLKHEESGFIVATVDDESIKNLTTNDIKVATRLHLKVSHI